jgi:hypothetical protein
VLPAGPHARGGLPLLPPVFPEFGFAPGLSPARQASSRFSVCDSFVLCGAEQSERYLHCPLLVEQICIVFPTSGDEILLPVSTRFNRLFFPKTAL